MRSLYFKVAWRVRLLYDAIKSLMVNPRKKPWVNLILQLFTCSEDLLEDFLNSFALQHNRRGILFQFDPFFLQVPNELCDRDILMQLLEIVYPSLSGHCLPFILKEGPYEYGPVKIEPGDVVIDAGASIGFFAIMSACKVGKEGAVYAFEPYPEALKHLRFNQKINRLKNLEIIGKALGNAVGSLTLYQGGLAESSGKIPVSGTIFTAEQTTVDAFVRTMNLKKLDFIKMDVEGMERELLMGACDTLARHKPKLSIATYHLPEDSEVIPTMIHQVCAEYRIIRKEKKLYAYVPKR